MVNLYETIGLDRDQPTAVLQGNLRDVKAGWSSKASRAGSLGDKARAMLRLIDRAEEAFRDDDSRERYDLSLIRARVAEAEPASVDWMIRAWSYYFSHDDGAAAVAARKAREQDPENAMVYVVSAWVKLRQNDLRQARLDADEAFVLDELGEDTADVHHVRGVVFYMLDDPDRALQSFERALAKASDGEKPEIYVRMAWVQEKKNNWRQALDLCLRGLSSDLDLSTETGGLLHQTAARMIARLCDDPDNPTESVAKYESRKQQLQNGAVRLDSKSVLVRFIDANIGRLLQLRELREKIAVVERERTTLSTIKNAEGTKPSIPIIGIGVSFFGLLLTGAWVGFIVVLLFGLGYTVIKFGQLSEWNTTRSNWEAARAKIEYADQKLQTLRPNQRPLTQVVTLEQSERNPS